MREINISLTCPIPPADFWALRSDLNFDSYYADMDGQVYSLVSNNETVVNGLTKVQRVAQLLYKENPVPAGLRGVLSTLGLGENFPFILRSSFFREAFDQRHAYTYTTELPVLTDRILIR